MTENEKDEKDLQAYRKVMALSDLEICQELANIEGLLTYVQFDTVRVNVPDGDDYYFNPLTNKEQCFDLFLKHDVQRTWEPYDFVGWGYHVLYGVNPIHISELQDYGDNPSPDLPPQKAICLAIILNKSEKFKVT